MAWCFHQFTCYIPLSPKDWDLEKFTSSFLSFMVNYNVLDKVWLVMRRLRPGLPSDVLSEGVRTSAVHTAPSSSSIICLPHSSIFFSLNYSIGSVKICQYISNTRVFDSQISFAISSPTLKVYWSSQKRVERNLLVFDIFFTDSVSKLYCRN